jgi:hypothetical protein
LADPLGDLCPLFGLSVFLLFDSGEERPFDSADAPGMSSDLEFDPSLEAELWVCVVCEESLDVTSVGITDPLSEVWGADETSFA